MIAVALIAVLQTTNALLPLTVRGEKGTTSVPVVSTASGPMIRAADVLTSIGASIVQLEGSRFRLVVGPTQVDLEVGIAVARTSSGNQQLAGAPMRRDGDLYLPLSLITELLPRVSARFQYDAARRELRRGEALAVTPPAKATRSPTPATPTTRSTPKTKHIVVVDAGHGGEDRGMKGPNRRRPKLEEASVTLSVARRLRSELKDAGIEVVMTRSTDTLIALSDRGRIANEAHGTLFVSIHVNAANPRWRSPGAARGFETYFLAEAKTEDERRVQEMENEAIKYEGEESLNAGDPLSFILNDMKQNEHLRESSDLAATIQDALSEMPHPGANRGVKQAGFRVLVTAYMPAVLVEIGYGTNPSEADFLLSDGGQKKIARAIAGAVNRYLERLDRRTGTQGDTP